MCLKHSIPVKFTHYLHSCTYDCTIQCMHQSFDLRDLQGVRDVRDWRGRAGRVGFVVRCAGQSDHRPQQRNALSYAQLWVVWNLWDSWNMWGVPARRAEAASVTTAPSSGMCAAVLRSALRGSRLGSNGVGAAAERCGGAMQPLGLEIGVLGLRPGFDLWGLRF